MSEAQSIQSVHRVLARELTDEEISYVSGGDCSVALSQAKCTSARCDEIVMVADCVDQSV